jgi:CheY-like chemotaxis protein
MDRSELTFKYGCLAQGERVYSILVVDDEIELRKQVVSLLKERGYEVDEAADGMEAAEILSRWNF